MPEEQPKKSTQQFKRTILKSYKVGLVDELDLVDTITSADKVPSLGTISFEQSGPFLFIYFDGMGYGNFAFKNTSIFISAKGEAKVEDIIETVKQIIESKLNSSEIGTIIQINLVAALRENLNLEQYTVGSQFES